MYCNFRVNNTIGDKTRSNKHRICFPYVSIPILIEDFDCLHQLTNGQFSEVPCFMKHLLCFVFNCATWIKSNLQAYLLYILKLDWFDVLIIIDLIRLIKCNFSLHIFLRPHMRIYIYIYTCIVYYWDYNSFLRSLFISMTSQQVLMIKMFLEMKCS